AASERIAALAEQPLAPAAPSPVAPSLEDVLELVRAERYEAALEALAARPLAERDEPRHLLLRAVLLLDAGAVQDAERAAHRLIGVPAVAASAHYLLGLCREHARDLDGAMRHRRRAIALDARFAMPHLHLGSLERRAGRRDEARRALERAAELLA